MFTDGPPRGKALRAQFEESDRLVGLRVPDDDSLRVPARAVQAALAADDRKAVQAACAAFLRETARFYGVAPPGVKVLASRPLRVREGYQTELFGDYDPATAQIRVWMRTAVHKRVTSFGTFLSTLCHEFCHHLDIVKLGFRDSPHTRGFFERTAVLYHHARQTPPKPLVWIALKGGRWRIDWQKTRSGGETA